MAFTPFVTSSELLASQLNAAFIGVTASFNAELVSATASLLNNTEVVQATSSLVTDPELVSATSSLINNTEVVSATSSLAPNASVVAATASLIDNAEVVSATASLINNVALVEATGSLSGGGVTPGQLVSATASFLFITGGIATNLSVSNFTASGSVSIFGYLPLTGGTVTGSSTFSGALTQLGSATADVVVGAAGVGVVGATKGNLIIPTVSGTPTGAPANSTLGTAIKYDIAGHKLWEYDTALAMWTASGSTAASLPWVQPETFGAVADGVTDCTLAFKNMVTTATTGSMIFFQAGTYLITGGITVNRELTFQGAGRLATSITTNNANAQCFTFSAAVNVSDIGFNCSTTATSGTMLTYNTASVRARLSRFWMTNFFSGIESFGVDVEFTDGQMLNWAVGGTGIFLPNSLAGLIHNVTMQQGSAPGNGNGIVIYNGGPTISDCQILACGNALYIGPGSGQTAASIQVINSNFDSSVNAMVVAPTGTGVVERCWFIGCWFGGSSQYGVNITAGSALSSVDGLDFVNCHVLGNGLAGFIIPNANATNLHWLGCKIAGNGSYGIEYFAGGQFFSIIDCVIGPYGGFGANPDASVYLSTTATSDYRIVGNDLTNGGGNSLTGAGIQTGVSPGLTEIITNNMGYVSSNRFEATIPAGATSVLVHHGLSGTPNLWDIVVSCLTGMGNPPQAIPFVISPNSGSFTIEIGIPLAFNTGFTWWAKLPCTPS